MWKDLFATAATDLPLVAMFFFMAVFAVVLVRVLSKRRKTHYDHMSRMPLDDSDPNDQPEVSR